MKIMRESRIPFRVSPMLATLVAEPFDLPGWIYEEKYDGDRALAYKEGGKVRILSRNGKDWTDRFAVIAAAIAKLPSRTLLLDGEIVVFDKKNISHFQALQEGRGKPVFAIFDCLYRNGQDLRKKPLSERLKALHAAFRAGPVLRPARRLAANGRELARRLQCLVCQ